MLPMKQLCALPHQTPSQTRDLIRLRLRVDFTSSVNREHKLEIIESSNTLPYSTHDQKLLFTVYTSAAGRQSRPRFAMNVNGWCRCSECVCVSAEFGGSWLTMIMAVNVCCTGYFPAVNTAPSRTDCELTGSYWWKDEVWPLLVKEVITAQHACPSRWGVWSPCATPITYKRESVIKLWANIIKYKN